MEPIAALHSNRKHLQEGERLKTNTGYRQVSEADPPSEKVLNIDGVSPEKALKPTKLSPTSNYQSHGPSFYDLLSTNSEIGLISKAIGSAGRSCSHL